MNFVFQNISSRNNLNQNENRQLLLIIVLFIFAPFVIFLYALFTYQNRNSQIIIVLFTALFGFNMIAESEGMDLSRNHELLLYYNQFSVFEIVKTYFEGIFHTNNSKSVKNEDLEQNLDLYIGFFGVIVSRFTTNAKVFMAVLGLIYGFVFVKSMQKFIEIQPKSLLSSIPVLCAAFMMPLEQLAGVRYATATYLFFWGVISVLNNNNSKYYILLFFACLTHFSFMIPTFLFVAFRFYSMNINDTKIKILYVIFIVSFFFPNLTLNLLTNDFIKNIVGAGLQNRSSEYTNVEQNTQSAIDYLANSAWYIVYPFKLVFWFVYSVVFVKYIPFFKIKHSITSDKLLVWMLILLSFSNFSNGVSNLGYRLLLVTTVFFFYYLLKLYSENKDLQIVKRLLYFALLFISLKIILEIRFTLEYLTPIFFYGSVFHIINDNATISLWTHISDFIFTLSHRKA